MRNLIKMGAVWASKLENEIIRIVFRRNATNCISPYAIVICVCVCVRVCMCVYATYKFKMADKIAAVKLYNWP